jgi:predicted transcriptional regulator
MLEGILPDRRISAIAKENPVTMNADQSAAAARELLSRKRINNVPVMQRDKLVGLVTLTQILTVLPARERVGTKSRSPETRSGLDFPVKDIRMLIP